MIDDTREKVIQLEVEVRHLREDLKETMAIINELNQVFQQAKGARYILVATAAVSGFIAAYIPTVMSYFSALPR